MRWNLIGKGVFSARYVVGFADGDAFVGCPEGIGSEVDAGAVYVDTGFAGYLDPGERKVREHLVFFIATIKLIGDYRRALKALLAFGERDSTLVDEALRRSFVTAKESDNSNVRFFEVVADVLCSSQTHGFRFEQVACLGLFNLCHPLHAVRSLALDILEDL